MKLKSFCVFRYRNVLDSTEVLVEDDVTTLVGMNESGKSTMLDALYRLKPVYGDKFDELEDYPRWRRSRDSRKEDLQSISPIEATFVLDEEDHEVLRELLGEGVVVAENVKAGRRYNGKHWMKVAIDEARFISNVLEGHPQAKALAEAHKTVASLKEALTALEKEGAAAASGESSEELASDGLSSAQVIERITKLLGADGDLGLRAKSVIWSRVPQFFLFTDYQSLDGRVDVSELKTDSDEEPGASPKQTARALLKLANTDVNAMTDSSFESEPIRVFV